MGMNIYNYLGSYVELPVVEQTLKQTFYGCSNSQCQNHGYMPRGNNFCFICGSPGQTRQTSTSVNQSLDWYEFCETHGLPAESLICVNDTDCLIPNIAVKYSTTLNDEVTNTEITPDYILKSIKEFKDNFEDALSKFKEIYGFELIVKFGIISYWA